MNPDTGKPHRYTMGWIFLIALLAIVGMDVYYLLNDLTIALVLAIMSVAMLVAYLDWQTFSLRLDDEAIHCGSIFYKRTIPFDSIGSVGHIFGKSSDFIVVKPRTGRSLTIWMYLEHFTDVLAQINASAGQAGALIRRRDKWGKWS